MKKSYEKPMAEKIQFDYSAQVVASTATGNFHSNYYAGCRAFWQYGCTDLPYPNP